MAAWGDTEDSSSNDDQKKTINICFMTWEDEVYSTSYSNLDIDIDELFDSYNELMVEYKKLNKKRKETNSLNEKLNNQLGELVKEKDKLALENETLRNEKTRLD